MRPAAACGLALALVVLSSTSSARAQDDPRALVQKAVKAAGLDRSGPLPASHLRIKGTFAFDKSDFTGEIWTEPTGSFKNVFQIHVGGQGTTVAQALHEGKAWAATDGKVEPLDADTAADMKLSPYHERLLALTPLLEDKGFKLAPLGESRVDGKSARGIKVSFAGRPDFKLYFDTETGFLVRTEYQVRKESQGKEVTVTTTLGDYRDVDPAAPERRALERAGRKTDPASVLAFLREQVRSDADRARIRELVKRLADEDFEARKKATDELTRLGAAALPQLQDAAREDNPDEETRRRARDILKSIKDAPVTEPALVAALRLVGLQRPPGVAEVLLDLAPSLAGEKLTRELRFALAACALRDGQADPAVTKALESTDAARRTTARAALGQDASELARTPGRLLPITSGKQPTRVSIAQDGEKQMEWEVTELQFFNRFDPSLYAPPR